MTEKRDNANSNLKSFMGRFDITVTDISLWINKSVVSTSKKIKNQTFTQREMVMIVKELNTFEKVDMNIFM